MKTNNQKIMMKSTKNSPIRTYFLMYPLTSKCENLKILSGYSMHDIVLLMQDIAEHIYKTFLSLLTITMHNLVPYNF